MNDEMLIGLNGDSASVKVLQQDVLMNAIVVKGNIRHEDLTPVFQAARCLGFELRLTRFVANSKCEVGQVQKPTARVFGSTSLRKLSYARADKRQRNRIRAVA
jgi:hypothetical protein